MLFLIVSSLPFILILSKPFLLWRELLCLVQRLWKKFRPGGYLSMKMSSKKKSISEVESVAETGEMSIMDLPELALDIILGKLPPARLANMAGVCRSLRERCRSDHMWEKHMSRKWERLMGPAARSEWQLYVASKSVSIGGAVEGKAKGWFGSLSCLWPLLWVRSKLGVCDKPASNLPDASIMSWYLSLESGKFRFPAQVYNRENGHAGFMLSCYDAEVSYDCHTDTFHARYPPHGQRTIVVEEGVQWERLRAPPVETAARELHISNCLNVLRPSDHIEIQWRRNKEFPYGWWYGVVGHLEACDGSDYRCRCHNSVLQGNLSLSFLVLDIAFSDETIVLEFNHYTPGSRWRRAAINRKNHREEGNETDGFYGGIRKLETKDEIAMWRQLWPNEVLE